MELQLNNSIEDNGLAPHYKPERLFKMVALQEATSFPSDPRQSILKSFFTCLNTPYNPYTFYTIECLLNKIIFYS